jgi:hypothetical protein
MIYKHDTAFLLALAQENMNSLTLRTPKWRSIYCEQHQLAMVVNTNSRPHFKHIYQLATIFVKKKIWYSATYTTKMFKSSIAQVNEVQSSVWVLG